jgi:hypothetical protein
MLQSSRSGHSRESRLADAISDNFQDQLRATPLQSMKHEEGKVKTRVDKFIPTV